MIRSMTGYASDMKTTPRYDVFMEIKSVNSRYFEFKVKSTYILNDLELIMKNRVFEVLNRGKVDLFVKVVEKDAANYNIVVNHDLARKYKDALLSLSAKEDILPDMSVRDFLSIDGILNMERIEGDDEMERVVMELLDELLTRIVEMMEREGEKTREDIEKSLNVLKDSVKNIEKEYPKSVDKYKGALLDRIREMMGNGLEENRILMEVELVASRTAINEELVRLHSHVSQMEKILAGKVKGDSKKLDFIAQEMNREANTIASKSSEYAIISNTIVIRDEIEKIREQLRNIV